MTVRSARPTLIEDALTAGTDFTLVTPKGTTVSFEWMEVEPARDMPNRYEGWRVTLRQDRAGDAVIRVNCSDIRVHDIDGAPDHCMRLELADSDLTYTKELFLPYRTRIEFGFDED